MQCSRLCVQCVESLIGSETKTKTGNIKENWQPGGNFAVYSRKEVGNGKGKKVDTFSKPEKQRGVR